MVSRGLFAILPVQILRLRVRSFRIYSHALMSSLHNLFNSLQTFDLGGGRKASFYSLPALEAAGVGNISRLPVSIRIVLESVLRNFDGGTKVSEQAVKMLASWNARKPAQEEIPFVV